MTDYEIFNWLHAHMVYIERLKGHKYALTWKNIDGKQYIIMGGDIKDCVRKANNV